MYFIGIIPPKDIREKIVLLQRSAERNRLPDYVPPHITIVPPFSSDSIPALPQSAMKILFDSEEFEIKIKGVESFGAHTVYLDVDSVSLLSFQAKFIESLFSEHFIERNQLGRKEFHPHITIGQRRHGLSFKELSQLRIAGKNSDIIGQGFLVNAISILGKVNSKSYSIVNTIQLGIT